MADALDSKSSLRKKVWVQVPPPALNQGKDLRQPLVFRDSYIIRSRCRISAS